MISTKRAIILATIAGVAVVCVTAALHAGPEPATPESVLGGPRVTDRPVRLTIIARDSEGKLVRLEERPEAAAVALLKLSGDPKKAADKVLNEHAAAVAKALNEHRGLFLQIQSARQNGDQGGRAAAPLIRDLRQKAPQLWEPPLLDRLAKAIPVDKAVQLRTIVNEYLVELAAEGGPDGKGRASTPQPRTGGGEGGSMMGEGEGMMTGGGGGGGGANPMPEPNVLDDPQTARRIENALVLREMARSLKTLTDMRKEQTERLLAGLGLSPEADAKIRGMIRDTGAKAKDGHPSREEHRALIEEIRKLLTPEQDRQLTENLKNR